MDGIGIALVIGLNPRASLFACLIHLKKRILSIDSKCDWSPIIEKGVFLRIIFPSHIYKN